MSGPGVGFEYPSVPVSWYKRDVLLFANAIGCDAKDELHFLYVCALATFNPERMDRTEGLIGIPPKVQHIPYLLDYLAIQRNLGGDHRLLRFSELQACCHT